MREKFNKFLKRHRAYRRYYRAVREQGQTALFESELRNCPALLFFVFDPDITQEWSEKGISYWYSIHEKWLKELSK